MTQQAKMHKRLDGDEGVGVADRFARTLDVMQDAYKMPTKSKSVIRAEKAVMERMRPDIRTLYVPSEVYKPLWEYTQLMHVRNLNLGRQPYPKMDKSIMSFMQPCGTVTKIKEGYGWLASEK